MNSAYTQLQRLLCEEDGDLEFWLLSLPENATVQQAWESCDRADWMLLLAVRSDINCAAILTAIDEVVEAAVARADCATAIRVTAIRFMMYAKELSKATTMAASAIDVAKQAAAESHAAEHPDYIEARRFDAVALCGNAAEAAIDLSASAVLFGRITGIASVQCGQPTDDAPFSLASIVRHHFDDAKAWGIGIDLS